MRSAIWKGFNKESKLNQDKLQTKNDATDSKDSRFTRKEKIDLIFRIIGTIAIATPVLMFVLQQRAGVKQQKAMMQLEAYTNTTRELTAILRRPVNSAEFNQSKDKLEFDLFPKIEYLFGADINSQLESLNRTVLFYADISKAVTIEDSLYILEKKLGDYLCSYKDEAVKKLDDEQGVKKDSAQLDSWIADFIDQSKQLNQWSEEGLASDEQLLSSLSELKKLMAGQLPFHVSYQTDCNDILYAFQNKREVEASDLKNTFSALVQKKQKLNRNKTQMVGAFQAVKTNTKEYMKEQIELLKRKMKENNKLLQN